MSYSRDDVEGRARQYAAKKGVVLVDQLGFGVHGTVWSTNRSTAIKVHSPALLHYERERDIYLRLLQHGVTELIGCQVPELLDFDNELRIIEIGIVKPPFVLDFAGAYLDETPRLFAGSLGGMGSRKARAVWGRELASHKSGRRRTTPIRHLYERRLAQQHSSRVAPSRFTTPLRVEQPRPFPLLSTPCQPTSARSRACPPRWQSRA